MIGEGDLRQEGFVVEANPNAPEERLPQVVHGLVELGLRHRVERGHQLDVVGVLRNAQRQGVEVDLHVDAKSAGGEKNHRSAGEAQIVSGCVRRCQQHQ